MLQIESAKREQARAPGGPRCRMQRLLEHEQTCLKCQKNPDGDCRRHRQRSDFFRSFQALETGWLRLQFLGNRLAASEGATSNTRLLTAMERHRPAHVASGGDSWGWDPDSCAHARVCVRGCTRAAWRSVARASPPYTGARDAEPSRVLYAAPGHVV